MLKAKKGNGMRPLFLITLLLLVSGCTVDEFCKANGGGRICAERREELAAQRNQDSKEKLDAIHRGCEDKKKKGIYKTYSQTLRVCEKPQVIAHLNAINVPNVDLVNSWYAQRIVIAEKLERKKITQAEADAELAQAELVLSNHRMERDARREEQLNSQLLMLMAIEQQSRPQPSNKIHCSTKYNPIGAIGGSIDTDCE